MLWYLCMPYACQNKEKEKTEGAPGTGICMEIKKKKRMFCKFSAKCLYDSENSLKFMAQKDEMSVINFIN